MAPDASSIGYKSTRSQERSRRFSPSMWLALALGIALVLGGTLGTALLTPGRVIRGELKSAASDLRSSYAGPDAAELRRLRRDFPNHAATIDATAWPQVAVTLHGLTRDACRDAARDARRIEGLVVIELERYRSADECRAANDMTWRFMP